MKMKTLHSPKVEEPAPRTDHIGCTKPPAAGVLQVVTADARAAGDL